jgi:hypothetical protein
MMEQSRKMVQANPMKGSSVEWHKKVSSPKLAQQDFQYKPPEGTVLKDNLIGDMMGGFKGATDQSKS